MLTCKVGNKTISSLNKKNKDKLRKWSDKGILKCPICSKQMIFKSGELVTWHFAHKSKCDFDDIYSEPETEEHMKGKKYLHIWFKRQPNIKKVELEKWIPEVKLRPDLFVIDNEGKEYCIEFQCSSISLEKKNSKTELYETMGYEVIWIFGTERIGKNSKVADKYRLDVKEKLFQIGGYQQKFKNRENLYFENGEIFCNKIINNQFETYLKNISNSYKKDLLSQQIETYYEAIEDIVLNHKDKLDELSFKERMYVLNEYNLIRRL